MVLELHVWGPAFNLPSIDPQCLAAIAYFSLAVPREEWVLIASSDASVSPNSEFLPLLFILFYFILFIYLFFLTDELPAVKNGNTWVSRFSNIVDYLSHHRWQLDGELSGLDKADNIAYVFFFFFFLLS